MAEVGRKSFVCGHPVAHSRSPMIHSHWLRQFGCSAREIDTAREEVLQLALLRGSRSGRIAYQFARDWSGRRATKQKK